MLKINVSSNRLLTPGIEPAVPGSQGAAAPFDLVIYSFSSTCIIDIS